MFVNLIYLTIGFFIMSFLFYLNHRFIFHSKNIPFFLKRWKKIHTEHHKNYFKPNGFDELGVMPLWGWLIFASFCLLISNFNAFLGLGMFIYVVFYEISHILAHSKRFRGFYRAHHHHHLLNSFSNYSITALLWDKLFKTYEKP